MGGGCPELASELVAFTQADLDQATCVRLEDHLSRCENCSQACESLKKTVSLCRRIPGDEVPGTVKSAVRQALSAAVAG